METFRFSAKMRRDGYKRPFDLVILVLAHLLLLPLWVLLWTLIPLAIWLQDQGPVFYRQRRVGKDGRVFTVLKFRTMVIHADSIGPLWTAKDDPRLTPLGRLLRRTALDELPQVLSIWKGDMSLVGPRALPEGEERLLESQIPSFRCRLAVVPGLTGMAQVYDKKDDPYEKLRYDLEYIAKMSPWLDMKLLFLSVVYTLLGMWDRRVGKSSQEVWLSNQSSASALPHLPSGIKGEQQPKGAAGAQSSPQSKKAP